MELNFNSLAGSSKPGEPQDVEVLIIGGGPAGLSAALYAARAEHHPIVLTGMELGGQAALTHIIENYPGFPEGLSGSELGELFKEQAERFGAQMVMDLATEVDFSERPFTVRTAGGTEYKAEAVIIATGATPRHLEVPGETEYTGKGVSYCGTCDGFFFKDKEVVVVGGGDSALEEGLFLTRFANKVTVMHRRNELRAGAILQNRAFGNPKMDFVWDTVITEIAAHEEEGLVNHVKILNKKTGEEAKHETDGVFIFIGHRPNSALFLGQVDMDDAGYIKTNMHMETSVPGVFAAGEIADPHFRQVITSAGMGAAAAIQATHFLEENS